MTDIWPTALVTAAIALALSAVVGLCELAGAAWSMWLERRQTRALRPAGRHPMAPWTVRP